MSREKFQWTGETDADLFVNHAQIRPKFHEVSTKKEQEEDEYPDCVWP